MKCINMYTSIIHYLLCLPIFCQVFSQSEHVFFRIISIAQSPRNALGSRLKVSSNKHNNHNSRRHTNMLIYFSLNTSCIWILETC